MNQSNEDRPLEESRLMPVTSALTPASFELLDLISNKCLKNCKTASCSCRKAGRLALYLNINTVSLL